MKPVQILLIEDSAGDVLLTQQAMAEFHVPVKFTVARDGEQALILLSDQDFKPDLIILDLNIPRITGQGFLERYKQRDAPIVVFSSSENRVEIQRVLELGARECTQKPSNLDEFNTVLRGILRKWVLGKDDASSAGTTSP